MTEGWKVGGLDDYLDLLQAILTLFSRRRSSTAPCGSGVRSSVPIAVHIAAPNADTDAKDDATSASASASGIDVIIVCHSYTTFASCGCEIGI